MGSSSSKPVKSTPKDVEQLLLWALSEQIRWSEQCHSAQQVLSLSSSELPSSIPLIRRGAIGSQFDSLFSSCDHTFELVDDIIGGGRDTFNVGKTKGEVNLVGKAEAEKKMEAAEANPIHERLASKGFAEAATKVAAMESAAAGAESGGSGTSSSGIPAPSSLSSTTGSSSGSSSASPLPPSNVGAAGASPKMATHVEVEHFQYPAHHSSSSSSALSSGLESVVHIVPTSTLNDVLADPSSGGETLQQEQLQQQPQQQQQQQLPLSSSSASASTGASPAFPPSTTSASTSGTTPSSRLQQERVEIASKFLFIHSLLERLVRSAESNYQLKCKIEFLRKRLKPKRSHLLGSDVEKERYHEELDSLHSLFAVQLESFDRARATIQWLIRDYSFNFALHKLHLQQHQTRRFRGELLREKQQRGASSLDELGKMRGGLSSMTNEEAREAGYTKKEIQQASKAPEAPDAPVPAVAPSSSAPSPLSSAPFTGTTTNTLASSTHHPQQQQREEFGQEDDQRLNQLNDLLSRLDEKEIRLHAAMLANEKESLGLGLSFLDHDYNGAIDSRQLPSARVLDILDPSRSGVITKAKLEGTVEEVGKRMEKREREMEKLEANLGNGSMKSESLNESMTRIDELKAENQQDRSLLRDVYQFFLQSFLSHLFSQIEQSNRTRFNPQSVDVNLLFQEMRLIEEDVAQSMIQDPLAVPSSSLAKEEEAELAALSPELEDQRKKAHKVDTTRFVSPTQQQVGSGWSKEKFERAPNDYAPSKDVELKTRKSGPTQNEKEKEGRDYEQEQATGGMGIGNDQAFRSSRDSAFQPRTFTSGPPTSTPTPTTSPHPFFTSSAVSDPEARREESRLDSVVEVGEGEMVEPKQSTSAIDETGFGFNKGERGTMGMDPKETRQYGATERRV